MSIDFEIKMFFSIIEIVAKITQMYSNSLFEGARLDLCNFFILNLNFADL